MAQIDAQLFFAPDAYSVGGRIRIAYIVNLLTNALEE
jgi:hypothetical protein